MNLSIGWIPKGEALCGFDGLGGLVLADIGAPQGVRAQALDEGRVGASLGLRQPRQERPLLAGSPSGLPGQNRVPSGGLERQVEARLLAADELDIDLGQDLGVEERSVL